MVRVPSDNHLLELADGRIIGYATWGDPEASPGFIGHGTPESRLDRYAALDDPEWVRRQDLFRSLVLQERPFPFSRVFPLQN